MNKKILLTIMSVFFLLSACAGDENSSGTSGKSDDGKKIVLWQTANGEIDEVIESAVKRFEEKNEGTTVEIVQVENDPYKTNLVVAMGGGNPPDVFTSWGGGWLKQFADGNQVLDLTDKADVEKYVPAAISASTFDDKVYGLPLGMAGVPIWYNKEIFEDHGLTPPKTYDELLTIIDKLNEENIIPFALANQSKWPGAFYFMYFADRLGGDELFESAFERGGLGFDDPAYVKAGEMVQELVERKAFPNGFNGLNYDTGQSRQLMYSGQAAMILQGTFMLSDLRTEAPDGFEENLGIFNFPEIEGGKGNPSNIIGGVTPVFSVSSKSKNTDLAVELIKEITGLEAAQEAADKAGRIPAYQGIEIKDEFVKKFGEFFDAANNMQTYYDQTLPPELAELHKDTTQGIFGLEMTPEEAAEKMEEKAKELLE